MQRWLHLRRDSYICTEIAVFVLNLSDIIFLRTAPHTVALHCVTITWQQIFKGSLQVTIVNVLFHMWLLTSGETDGGAGRAAAPPGRSFRSFWAHCHHIVSFIKWSLIDIAARQCVVFMIFGTLNYKNTLFWKSTGKQALTFSIWNIATRHCWKILHKTSMSKCLNRGPSMHLWGPTHALKGPTSCYNLNRGALRMHSWGPHACNQGALHTH